MNTKRLSNCFHKPSACAILMEFIIVNKDIKIIVYSETLLLISCTVFSNSSFLLFSGYVVKNINTWNTSNILRTLCLGKAEKTLYQPINVLQILSVTCTDDDASTILTYQILSGDHGHFSISAQGDIIVANGKKFLNLISIEFRFLFLCIGDF